MRHEQPSTFATTSQSAPPVVGGAPGAAAAPEAPHGLASLLFDRLGNASRPKLLFLVASADVITIFGIWLALECLFHPGTTPSLIAILGAAAVAFLSSAMLRAQWSYSIPSLRRLTYQILKVMTSVFTVFLLAAGISYLLEERFVPPVLLTTWMVLSALALCAIRYGAAEVVEALTRTGRLMRRTVIVGGGKDAIELIRALNADNGNHMKILGIFDDRQDERAATGYEGIAHLGTFEKLSSFCRDMGVDLLIVTVPPRAEERLMQILQKLFTLQVDVRVSALNSKLRLNSRAYSYIGRVPMLAVLDKPLSDWDRVLKNIEDRVIGALLLLIAAPIMAIVALAVRLESRGPVLFRQKRYGFNNELIEIYKFRSMYVDKLDANATKLVTRDDPRVTAVGRFIRKTSLDELPQLYNVVRGQMSLVGPRPHATGAKAERDLYEDVVQGYFARHRMKPGVTGWAQINGWRGETDTHEKLLRRVEHDLYYIDNWSVMLDLYIIAVTPFSLATKNAY